MYGQQSTAARLEMTSPAQPRLLSLSIAEANEALASVSGRIDALEEKLGLVLTPEPATGGATMQALQAISPNSPAVVSVDTFAALVANLGSRIEYLMGRLAL